MEKLPSLTPQSSSFFGLGVSRISECAGTTGSFVCSFSFQARRGAQVITGVESQASASPKL